MAFTSGTPTGQISLSQVQSEFGGSNPIGMNEYYGCAWNVPTSGAISMNSLRGKYRYHGGFRFIYRFQSVNTFNDRVERNGSGFGWRLRTYNSTNLSANPGTDGAAIRSDGTHRMSGRRGCIVEKLFWFYHSSRWRLYLQTYDFTTPYSYQARDCAPLPYDRAIRVTMNTSGAPGNGQYTQSMAFQSGTGPSGSTNPYKIVTGDASRRRIYAWYWNTGISFSNYIDFQ